MKHVLGPRGGELAEVVCPCGQTFTTPLRRLLAGRGLYHSRECMYRFRVRPSGLKYTLHQQNRAWFRTGHNRTPRGAAHHSWRGDRVGYRDLHRWVAHEKGERPTACEWCGREGRTEWANISHTYRREVSDWAALCRPCHRSHDSGESRGLATNRFGAHAVQNGGSWS